MTDYPIIFSAPMVRALLDGRKTMTRRLAWRWMDVNDNHTKLPSPWQRVKPGDRLWVRENLKKVGSPHHCWTYSADSLPVSLQRSDPRTTAMIAWAHHKEGNSTPSIHMPRWASRLTLVVTATKIEGLQTISEQDCEREGCMWHRALDVWQVIGAALPSGAPIAESTARNAFAALWDTINGSGAWGDNPEVVALTFTVHKQNIGAMEKVA